jgi:putative CocE/NonD family hydrolase
MSDPPPELAAAVVTVGPHDLHESSWGTGSLALADLLGWSDVVANQEAHPVRRIAYQFRAAGRLAGAVHGVPVAGSARALLGGGAPWFESWVDRPDADDPFWAGMRATTALERAAVPVLLLGGWQDIFIDQTLTQYRHLRDRGTDVAMTIGPWTHDQMVTAAGGTAAAETLAWLGTHLAKKPGPPRVASVRVFITGRNRDGWVDLPDWPPATTAKVLYLQAGGRLESTPSTAATSTFRYNPADPTPTVGGRLLAVPTDLASALRSPLTRGARGLADALGLPAPETGTERVVQQAGQSVVGMAPLTRAAIRGQTFLSTRTRRGRRRARRRF